MAYLQVAAGLVLLVLAGDFLVRGAVSLAQRMGVSTLVIGLTIVAFGTSAPELVVGVDAVLSGSPTLALGNVVGSNIANVLLVLGLPALILPIACTANRIGRNMVFMLTATIIFMAMGFSGPFTWLQGVILMVLLITFLIYSGKYGQEHPEEVEVIEELEDEKEHPTKPLVAWVMIVGGLLGLVYGAELLVEGAVTIARAWGVGEAVIGLTLVAIGTSLPELVTAIVAAYRGHADVAVGNVIGSNIFNVLGIIGVSSFFGNIPVPASFLEVDLWVMLGATLLLLPFTIFKAHIGKLAGAGLLSIYVIYLVYLIQSPSATALGLGA